MAKEVRYQTVFQQNQIHFQQQIKLRTVSACNQSLAQFGFFIQQFCNIIHRFMERQDRLLTNYNIYQSTLLQPYASVTNILPTSGSSLNNYIQPSTSGWATFEGHNSKNSVGPVRMASNNNEGFNHNSYTNLHFDNFGGSPLSKSTIIEHKHSANAQFKLGEFYSPKQKVFNLNKYVNQSATKQNVRNNEEHLQQASHLKGNMGSPQSILQKKNPQNFSFQFSPRKAKKSEQSINTFKQFVAVEPKTPVEIKNNLSNYKSLEFSSPQNRHLSTNIKFTANNGIAASSIQSPNNSLEQNKFFNRGLSSVKLNVGLQGLQRDSLLSTDADSFSYQSQKSNHLTTTQRTLLTKDDFTFIKRLGKGKYGDVFLTQHKYTKLICALKVIPKQTITKEEGGINQFVREVIIQIYLNSPYIIGLWGIFQKHQNVYLIMEPGLDGQLDQHLKQRKQLSEVNAASLIQQLCAGVQYLQSQKIIHRDLKPQNILLHQGRLKICDFGWAVYNQNNFRQTFCGTPLYLSPDVLKGDQYNDKVDNWAIGIITYEMLIGKIPFKIVQESDMEKILNEEIQFPSYIKISDIAKDFILCLLDRDPDSRMDIEGVLHHKFLIQNN